MSFFV
jgi:hypothetical protein